MTHKLLAPLALIAALGLACTSDDTSTGTDTNTSSTTDDTTTTSTGTTTSPGTTSTTATTAVDTETESGTTATTDPDTTTAACEDGTENCPCIGGATCDAGLMCQNNVCVPEVQKSFCERIGGVDGIAALNVSFITKVLVDERINAYFLNSDVDGANLLSCVNDQIGEAVGCPDVVYSCADMLTAHAGLNISTQDFTDFAEDYAAALAEHQGTHPDLTDDDVATIMGVLAGMAGDIVEAPNDNESVYHRLGRKEGFKALVGAPDEAGSFIANVAANPAINGFFANPNLARLTTCLTRQLGGIDGPAKYGMEVDSPGAGVDEGVALADPCKDMKSSHEGLTDQGDNSLITYDDFMSLVGDLINAMDSFAVAADDKTAILTVLAPMCEDIVADSPNDCPGNNEILVQSLAPQNPTIVDDAYNGTLGSMNCATVDIPDNGLNFIAAAKLTGVKIDHTWVGDLVIKVVAPDNTAITVLSRPGLVEAGDNGSGIGGDSANLVSTHAIEFYDGGPKDAELMGNESASTAFEICKGMPSFCKYDPNPGSATPGKFASLKNKKASGTWRVCVADGGANDTGTFVGATLEIERVKFMLP